MVEIAKERVEQMGIIFIDEIDKVAGNKGGHSGPDVSREGVQRDILPIVEGSKVSTKWGMIDTTHILFIAAGAFHVSKPSDLIPELQGRFPLRVELKELTSDDFLRILKEPENAIVKQYVELMRTEQVELVQRRCGAAGISEIACSSHSPYGEFGREDSPRSWNACSRHLVSVHSPYGWRETGRCRSILCGLTRTFGLILENEDLSRYYPVEH